MKTSVINFLSVIMLFGAMSCERDEIVQEEKQGKVSFSYLQSGSISGRSNSEAEPAAVLISVKKTNGEEVLSSKNFSLIKFGDKFISEDISLSVGNFQLTSFIVLDASGNALYATPVAGSPKAGQVDFPLPISFAVSEGNNVVVKPQVISIAETDTPESFGYVSFGFEVVNPAIVKAKVKVELTVGNITYLDVDTKVNVKGYDASNQLLWENDYDYVGPEPNLLPLKKGFHHYTFSIDQWGIKDTQIIHGDKIIEDASQDVQVSYVMGGSAAPKLLSHYITYIERPDNSEWGGTVMKPESKLEYEFKNGKLDKMRFYGYVDSLEEFHEQRYFKFTYTDGRVSKLSGYHVGHVTPYIDDFYFYTYGKVTRIQEVNYAAGITSEVNISYNNDFSLVNAVYTLSNGTGFNYEFVYRGNNLKSDVTSRGGQLCSQGSYTYDKSINPLKHLGYDDFLFRNYSANNKIAEQVNYTGCAFPTLIPEVWEHDYDADGYPAVTTTLYKGRNLKMQTKYFYQ